MSGCAIELARESLMSLEACLVRLAFILVEVVNDVVR